MKNSFILGLSGLLSIGASSCVSSGSYDNLRSQYDSITKLNMYMEQDLYQTDSLVASVLSHFQEISHIENMINVNVSVGERPKREQERIKDNMRQIYERLDRSSEVIDALTKQLELNGRDNSRLAGTISLLRLQIEQQRMHAEIFEREINGRNTTLQVLERRISQLKHEAQQIKRDQDLFAELLDAREKKQNEVRYCLGTYTDLLEMGVINKDKSFDIKMPQLDYLTTVDQMKFRSLEIKASQVKFLSMHPSSTYTLTPKGKTTLLEINDPEGFWAYTRLMVIEVN